MPLEDSNATMQVIAAFVVIGLLGFVLRWTFSRDLREPPHDATPLDLPPDSPAVPVASALPVVSASPASVGTAETAVGDDNFGLLATVTMVSTADEARRLRTRLTDAGIRATTAVDTDGRHRVLVFATDTHRAQRVILSA